MKQRRFVDRVTACAEAGDGGDGIVGFRREKFVPRGGPDGGDGGKGGDVILRADRSVDSLVHIYFSPLLRAEHGLPGRGAQKHGRNGRDLVVKVPCGVQVSDADTGTLIGEVVEHGGTLTPALGGKGGLGNCHWKTSTHQAPTECTPGEPGEKKRLLLELKIPADLGLIGLPNAGKSSLLRAISRARPKVADYAFTTVNPIIGSIRFPDYTEIKVVDVPGLIEGASKGRGMGHEFLRHVERCRFLALVMDMAAGDGNQADDCETLFAELESHCKGLSERCAMIVANKMDLPESAENLKTFTARLQHKIIPVSAKTGLGIEQFKDELARLFARK